MEELKLDSKVARYLELTRELNKTKKDSDDANKERIFVICGSCRHLMVQTGYEEDRCPGGPARKHDGDEGHGTGDRPD